MSDGMEELGSTRRGREVGAVLGDGQNQRWWRLRSSSKMPAPSSMNGSDEFGHEESGSGCRISRTAGIGRLGGDEALGGCRSRADGAQWWKSSRAEAVKLQGAVVAFPWLCFWF